MNKNYCPYFFLLFLITIDMPSHTADQIVIFCSNVFSAAAYEYLACGAIESARNHHSNVELCDIELKTERSGTDKKLVIASERVNNYVMQQQFYDHGLAEINEGVPFLPDGIRDIIFDFAREQPEHSSVEKARERLEEVRKYRPFMNERIEIIKKRFESARRKEDGFKYLSIFFRLCGAYCAVSALDDLGLLR